MCGLSIQEVLPGRPFEMENSDLQQRSGLKILNTAKNRPFGNIYILAKENGKDGILGTE